MKKLRTHIIALVVALLGINFIIPLSVFGQEILYKYSLGVDVGMSGYAGDASSFLYRRPGFAADAIFRYQYDSRWAFGANVAYQTLSGNTEDLDGVRPGGIEYKFHSSVVDLNGRVEFNFFPYGIGETYKSLKRWTPYLTAGIGVSMAMCQKTTAIGPNIPLGFGVKYKPSEKINLFFEFSVTKIFNDHFDGPDLSDLSQIKSAFVKNNDWYSRLCIGLSFEFGERCETCHYVD